MKYLKKKKKSILPWVLLTLTAVLVGLVLVLTLLPGREPGPGPEATDTPGQTNPGEIPTDPAGETTEPLPEDLRIETPYITLVYPGQWAEKLQVDKRTGDPYWVIFSARLESGAVQELFSLGFGGGLETSVGVIKASGQEVPVHISVTDILPDESWTPEEINMVYAMQEAMNDVLVGLELASPQEQPQEQPQETRPQQTQPMEDQPGPTFPEDHGELRIDTPAGELVYPARWEDYLKLEIRQEGVYTLEFYAELEGYAPVALFNVYLGGDKGIYVMDITAPDGTAVALYVDIFEIEADGNWTEDERTLVLAMQEDMNYLLAALME